MRKKFNTPSTTALYVVEDFTCFCCINCTNTNFYEKLAFLCEKVDCFLNVSQVVSVNSVMIINFIPLSLENEDS